MSKAPRIVVAGAGAIGCYVGGLLSAGGRDVTFLARPRIADDVRKNGLTLTDFTGAETYVSDPNVRTDPDCLTMADIVLVTTKSSATSDIAHQIADRAPKAIVVSLQNGISNPDILRQSLPQADVRAGMVAFNVVQSAPGHYHQGTSGGITVELGDPEVSATLSAGALITTQHEDIRAVQWGKLLVNLNNALNALSGLTLLDQLQSRAWRHLLAAQMKETLAVLKTAQITPTRFSPLPPALVPHVLRLPNPLFKRIAKTMLTIDPHARSSMQDDLIAKRPTEIDALQGEVLRLAQHHGLTCPTLERVTAAIRKAETANAGPPNLTPELV